MLQHNLDIFYLEKLLKIRAGCEKSPILYPILYPVKNTYILRG